MTGIGDQRTDLLDNQKTLLVEDQKEDPEIAAEKLRNRYVRIQGQTLLLLPFNLYDLIHHSHSLPPKEKQKITPLNEETLDKLPMEIIWEICEYLNPISILNLENTCTNLYDSCQDKESWRKVCYRYQILLACDEFYVFKYFNQHRIFAIQKDLNAINNGNDKWKSDVKVDESLERYIGNNNGNNELVVLTNPESRELYIENLQDPKKTFLSQMKKLKNAIAKKEKIKGGVIRRREDNIRFGLHLEAIWRINGWYPALILIGIFVTILLINLVVIGRVTLPNKFWIFAPVVFPTFLFCVTLILQGFYKPEFLKVLIIIGILIYLALFNFPFYFIVLKVSDWVTWSWLKVFIPLLIVSGLFSIVSLVSLIVLFFQRPRELSSLILAAAYFAIFTASFIFLIFLGLKLDHTINWNWAFVFFPLFALSVLPSIVSWISALLSRNNFDIYLCIGVLLLVASVVIWITPLLFTLWLETDRIPTFTRVLIPTYMLTATCPITGISLIILWFKGIFKGNNTINFY
ncbi:dactylin [Anaeramoeba flamelloides]|uniref:Dactylin n=1 Tax=Anaeramoeba flamelloides TaxID=1746091 RepID=A0AAV7YNM2_9EUKA|nr:dactylin [Anaeramoeba flamelloides]